MGSGFYRLLTDDGTGPQVGAMPTLVATITAFVVGFAVIVGFLKLVETRSYLPFVIYRLVLAVAVVYMLGQGILSPY